MPSGQPAPKMVICAPREVSLAKFYGNGGVEETTRFLARMERAWEFLHLDTEKEKISFFYEKIGEEVESEIDCHLEGKSAISQEVLDNLRKCYGEKRTVPALRRVFCNIKQRKDETVRAFSHRLKDAFDAVINRQRDSEIDLSPMDELRDTFVENLRDRQTRRHLRDQLTSSPNATFNEIRLQAVQMEDDDSDSEGEEARASLRQVTALSSEESSDYNEAVELLTKQVAKLTGLLIEQEHLRISQSRYDGDRSRPHAHRHNQSTLSSAGRNQRVTGAVCFRCGRQGHFARVCAQLPNSDFSVSPASRRGNERRDTQGVTPRGQAHSMSIYTDIEGGSERKIISSRVTGTVKWFNVKRGFGFITPDGTRKDIFVHYSSIVRNNPRKYLRSLGDGERVEFDVVEGRKGAMAINVTGTFGANVLGSRYAANIDKLNPRHHASRLGGNRQRRYKRCVGVVDYQSSDRPGGGRRNHCSGRRFPQHDQDYQPRQPRSGVSYDQPRESIPRPVIGRRGDNHRERHANDVTQNQTSDSGSATTSCVAGGPIVTNHRGRGQHQSKVTFRELRPLVGPSALTHQRKDASLPVLPDEQRLPRRSRRISRRPDRFGLY
ncbi:hypothetical protein RRG08_012731 [Elysia crispata]|uniref:CCHC-type domain-containing protein n=1 Tax=Elysia crispata TaxID=231223 RepID=A0AAE0YMD1_9GAST|nr:hypothetical protein RRG08_012731 [Elysia crispata]